MVISVFFTGIWLRSKKKFFQYVKKLPSVRHKIDEELSKTNQNFENEISKSCAKLYYNLELPENGLSNEKILKLVDQHLRIGIHTFFTFLYYCYYYFLKKKKSNINFDFFR